METGSTDPAWNLAYEEYVLTNRTDGDILMLWQNDNTIVIGQNQNTAAEINRRFVEEHGIHVVRRKTGGGAVYHDLGNLNYSFITDADGRDRMNFARFAGLIVDSLRRLGLDAEASGRNDILVGGRKVSGTAQRIAGGRLLYHGTLLFDSDPEMISGALNVDPDKFKGKATQSVRSRVGSIRAALAETGKDMGLSEFWDYLREVIASGAAEHDALSEEELSEVAGIADGTYRNWEWTYGRTHAYSVANKQRWGGGTLEVHMDCSHDRISEIRFFGDFLSLRPLSEIEGALAGCRVARDDLNEVLAGYELPEYFGSITRDEVIETILYQ